MVVSECDDRTGWIDSVLWCVWIGEVPDVTLNKVSGWNGGRWGRFCILREVSEKWNFERGMLTWYSMSDGCFWNLIIL